MEERRMQLYIDPAKCTGCRICEVFCSFKHEGAVQPSMSRITVVHGSEAGRFIPFTCVQCARPACAEVCPVYAITRDVESGVVAVHAEDCIGCRMCVQACPFGAMAFDRDRGIAYKCDLCGGDPECARMCPTGAIQFLREEVIVARRRKEGPAMLQRVAHLVEGE
jgi:Fe-S-cluster-containing hydrogenase component 2